MFFCELFGLLELEFDVETEVELLEVVVLIVFKCEIKNNSEENLEKLKREVFMQIPHI